MKSKQKRRLALTSLLSGFLLSTLAFLSVAVAQSPAQPTMDVSEVKPGMRGHAVTVFSGTQSDRFDIEVLDVMRDFVTGQDAVLFRSSDPRLKHTGIVGGMSGSPVYINGKLLGAVAYGFPFSKDPIGGITPIKKMLEVDALPYRPEILPGHPRPPAESVRRSARRSGARGRRGSYAWADAMLGLGTDPLPARRLPGESIQARAEAGHAVGGLESLGAPLSVAGLGQNAAQYLGQELGLQATTVGSSQNAQGYAKSDGKYHQRNWKGGDSVSVVLADGDNAISSNGTVTWVGGPNNDHLLAYGHPMMGYGPSNLPIADARVHTIIPSYRRSVKLASHLNLQGTMIQDRQPAISARTGVQTRMIPVTTHVRGPETNFPPRTYKSRVAVDADLTAKLVTTLLLDAVEEASNDGSEVVLATEHIIEYQSSSGRHRIKLEEESFFPNGVVRNLIGRHRGALLVSALMNNDFEVASIASIEQKAKVVFGNPAEEIESLAVPKDEIRAGEVLSVRVTFRGRYGKRRTETVKIRIPDDVGGQKVVLEIAGGEWATTYEPIADSLDDLVHAVSNTYSARSLVCSVFRGDEGLSTRHGLLTHLPDSVLETLQPQGTTQKSLPFKQVSRRVLKNKNIIFGAKHLELSILPKRAR